MNMRRKPSTILVIWSLAAMPVLLAGSPALAQTPAASKAGTGQASARLAQLASRLKMTPEQTEKLRPIIEKEMEELRTARAAHAADTPRMLGEMKAIHEKYEEQIAAVLTPEQLGEWQKIKEQRVARAEHLAQIQSRLKLTPDQTDALQPILQQEMDELRTVREKHSSDTSRRGKRNMLREMKSVQQK